jgi:hypothetical protein
MARPQGDPDGEDHGGEEAQDRIAQRKGRREGDRRAGGPRGRLAARVLGAAPPGAASGSRARPRRCRVAPGSERAPIARSRRALRRAAVELRPGHRFGPGDGEPRLGAGPWGGGAASDRGALGTEPRPFDSPSRLEQSAGVRARPPAGAGEDAKLRAHPGRRPLGAPRRPLGGAGRLPAGPLPDPGRLGVRCGGHARRRSPVRDDTRRFGSATEGRRFPGGPGTGRGDPESAPGGGHSEERRPGSAGPGPGFGPGRHLGAGRSRRLRLVRPPRQRTPPYRRRPAPCRRRRPTRGAVDASPNRYLGALRHCAQGGHPTRGAAGVHSRRSLGALRHCAQDRSPQPTRGAAGVYPSRLGALRHRAQGGHGQSRRLAGPEVAAARPDTHGPPGSRSHPGPGQGPDAASCRPGPAPREVGSSPHDGQRRGRPRRQRDRRA